MSKIAWVGAVSQTAFNNGSFGKRTLQEKPSILLHLTGTAWYPFKIAEKSGP
ncbi:MAG: hypothetical protein GY777_08615 [Candidatus Brocadiaceae bacterium]|nr:hypothetical protein [Candidatus Brocadiaceae bacterium]